MSAGKTSPSSWQKLQANLRARAARAYARTLMNKRAHALPWTGGGEWNGSTGPGPVDLAREIWAWRSLVFELAIQKTVARYRKSILGPAWIILGFALFVLGIAVLWSGLQTLDFRSHLPYVALGLFAWNIMLGVLTEGTRCLSENRSLIYQSTAPLLIYPIVTLVKQLFLGAHTLVVVIPVLIFCGVPLSWDLLWLIPNLVLMIAVCASISAGLAVCGAHFPDLAEIISNVLRFAFFFTPIFWMTDTRPQMHLIWTLNPFYYVVESVRGPVLGTSDPLFVATVMAGLAVVCSCISGIVYARWARSSRLRV